MASLLDRFLLTDRAALVTREGRAIGAAIAVAFTEAGADVPVRARTREHLEGTSPVPSELPDL